MDKLKESGFRSEAVKSEPPEDGIDTVIREVLEASMGKAEPSPTVWTRIQQYIEKKASYSRLEIPVS
jgi:hypothetical protein